MLFQLNGSTSEQTTTTTTSAIDERLPLSHERDSNAVHRQDNDALPPVLRAPSVAIELTARNEDILSTVSSAAVSLAAATVSHSRGPPTRPSPRAYLLHRAAVSMPHGNSTPPPVAMVPAPTASVPAAGRTPTEPGPARKVDILIYPTVSPETIVIPILSCIIGFPIFALLVICCLRRRAKIARERDRRRNFDLQANTITLVRFNSHHLNNQRSILLQSDSLSRGYPSLDLDTVYEEKSDTHCSSQLDSPAAHMLLTDSPPDTDNEHC